MFILGLDTSADETCASVVENGRTLLSNIISSQVDIHSQYGGIVPEIASREHLKRIIPSIQLSLEQAGLHLDHIDFLATGCGSVPGMMGEVVSVFTAKMLSYVLDVDLVGVNHMEGHIYAALLEYPSLDFPFLVLAVSGGHTLLVDAEDCGSYTVIGSTRDDAAGETFDKVARLLGLSYPGGPKIDKLSRQGDPTVFSFPRPMIDQQNYEFSFAGLKTSVLNLVRNMEAVEIAEQRSDIAASFQQAVVDVLVKKTIKAASKLRRETIVLVGGVAANSQLRSALDRQGAKCNKQVFYPSISLCTDNAAGIASCGYYQYKREGGSDPLELPVFKRNHPLVV